MTRQQRSAKADRIRIFRASVTKWQLKVLLTILGLGIMGAVLYFTMKIVDQLASNERRTVELYARLLARSYEQANDEDLLFYVDLAYTSIHFPVILTDTKSQPVYPYQQFMMNVELDTMLPVEQQKQWLLREIDMMKADYQP